MSELSNASFYLPMSGFRGLPLSSSHAMSWVGMMFVRAVVVAVGLLSRTFPPTSEREGLGAACAALGFSGVQRR